MPDLPDHSVDMRWADVAKQVGIPLVLHDHGVRRFSNANGDSIVEHAGGRFRMNPWTKEWEPDNA